MGARLAALPTACTALAACSHLAFLKAPSVPGIRGSAVTEPGPAMEVSVRSPRA